MNGANDQEILVLADIWRRLRKLPPDGRARVIAYLCERLRDSDGKHQIAQVLGHNGGTARASKLSPERRSEIARQGAAKRWNK